MNTRLLVATLVSIFVIATTVLLVQFAKGYRPDLHTGEIKPTGLLVATSEPKGAQVFINGQLKTATDDTLDLDPATYSVDIKKSGYIPWHKQLIVEKELVTQTDALLFPITPNLQSLTNTGALNPSLSPHGTKLLYVIPEATSSAGLTSPSPAGPAATATPPPNRNLRQQDLPGLWLLELTNLPLGFNQEAQQLIIGHPRQANWDTAVFQWSPDSREILALFYPQATKSSPNSTRPSVAYLINTNTTDQPVSQLTNIANRYEDILIEWQSEIQKQQQTQLNKLPPRFADLVATSAAHLRFSPDETKLLYTATASAQLADQYLPSVPAASTQTQHRTLQPMHTYVYDLKEDRNFLILNNDQTEAINQCELGSVGIEAQDTKSSLTGNQQLQPKADRPLGETTDNLICPKLMWFPTSRHLVYFNDQKVNIMEYDSTNNQVVYAGPIQSNYVFPHPSPSKLLIVTNLNPDAFPFPNIYTLSLK